MTKDIEVGQRVFIVQRWLTEGIVKDVVISVSKYGVNTEKYGQYVSFEEDDYSLSFAEAREIAQHRRYQEIQRLQRQIAHLAKMRF